MAKKSRRRLLFRRRVNFISALRAAKIVTTNPNFVPTSDRHLAEAILNEIAGDDLPQAKIDFSNIDWEKIIDFIIKMLPLLLMFI